jgi:uncharacterized protein (DUF3084 family)
MRKANTVLNTALEGPITSPTKRYICKLADEAERLNTHHILHEREVDNLRQIFQKRKAQTKGKRAILKGQFLISTEELMSQVVEAEAATAASQMSKKAAQPQMDKVTIEEMDDLDEEEAYDSDLDELG